MKRILLAIDNSKGSEQAVKTLAGWAKALKPESILLVHVQKLLGQSLLGKALESDQDLEEIGSALEGSEYLVKLDEVSAKIITHFTAILEQAGLKNISARVRQGHPAEQILATAKEEDVDLIVVGSRGKRIHSLLLGSVSREVANTADISVLVAR